MNRSDETEESGPIQEGIWDTRTRENSRWCNGCKHWLKLSAFSWLSADDALKFHQKEYCSLHPDFDPSASQK